MGGVGVQDRVALVTGASSGIGEASVKGLRKAAGLLCSGVSFGRGGVERKREEGRKEERTDDLVVVGEEWGLTWRMGGGV